MSRSYKTCEEKSYSLVRKGSSSSRCFKSIILYKDHFYGTITSVGHLALKELAPLLITDINNIPAQLRLDASFEKEFEKKRIHRITVNMMDAITQGFADHLINRLIGDEDLAAQRHDRANWLTNKSNELIKPEDRPPYGLNNKLVFNSEYDYLTTMANFAEMEGKYQAGQMAEGQDRCYQTKVVTIAGTNVKRYYVYLEDGLPVMKAGSHFKVRLNLSVNASNNDWTAYGVELLPFVLTTAKCEILNRPLRNEQAEPRPNPGAALFTMLEAVTTHYITVAQMGTTYKKLLAKTVIIWPEFSNEAASGQISLLKTLHKSTKAQAAILKRALLRRDIRETNDQDIF
ncbi:MAG: hypothetical protein M1829_001805 [Trizodia sp. TS-e1964]|nr:MAG: hypothetical protein M1829_001805 [Trizodia sp. TS-e1964]